MHGSRYLRRFVQARLEAVPAIVDALTDGTDGIVGGRTAPGAGTVLLHYPENLDYSGPITSDGKPVHETGTYVARLICDGTSDEPIVDAADAMLLALTGAEGNVAGEGVDAGATYSIRMDAIKEWPNTDYVEIVSGTARHTRELGDVFAVEITRSEQ